MPQDLEGFRQLTWSAEGTVKTVYIGGVEGNPPVVLMHELPGMVPQTVQLARDLVDEGFCVFMPLLFGTPNAPRWGILPYTAQICLSREFYLFARHRSSPILNWLRSLCREAQRRCDGRQVGVIGMCLTGNFALTLMTDDSVIAPVMSQPSLPVGPFAADREALATSEDILRHAQARSEAENIPILGLRFTCDSLCQAPRFRELERRFGERFRKIELDSSPGNPHGIASNAHAVLTVHRVRKEGHPTQEAYHQVVSFLREQLTPQQP